MPRNFLLSFILVGIVGFLFLGKFGYQESFLMLNALHFPLGDAIMPHLTHLADGILISCVVAWFYTQKDIAWVFSTIISLLLMAYIIQTLKYDYFTTWVRPVFTFPKGTFHNISLGECCNSFPSGHSAAAISMFVLYAFQWEKIKGYYGILAFAFAALLCYTRVYIGVHFLGDVLVGGLIGLLIPLTVLTFIYPKISQLIEKIAPEKRQYISHFLQIVAIVLFVFDIFRIAGIYSGWKMWIS